MPNSYMYRGQRYRNGKAEFPIVKDIANVSKLLSCEFNMDIACMELRFSDGTMIAIDTIAVENEVADTMYQRSEIDWLIYNRSLEYAQLVLGGDLEGYLKDTPEHRLMH